MYRENRGDRDDTLTPIEAAKEEKRRKMFILRNILNILFMFTAIVGVLWYYTSDKETGIIIVICSLPMKMTSTVLRFLKP